MTVVCHCHVKSQRATIVHQLFCIYAIANYAEKQRERLFVVVRSKCGNVFENQNILIDGDLPAPASFHLIP